MSNFPKSLNAYVDSAAVCRVLGSPLNLAARPLHAACPLCQRGLMQVFQGDDGGWFACPACGQSGDMIQLAQLAWKLDVYEAVAQLQRLGFDLPANREAIDAYLEGVVARRRAAADLWTAASKNLLNPGRWTSRLLDRCGYPPAVPTERMLAGPGGVLGVVDKVHVERCFAPRVMENAAAKGHRSNTSAHAVFRGAGWDAVATIPFYDRPGRISGFLFIGREGDPQQDHVFKVVATGFRGNQHTAAVMEAGLAFHPRVLKAADRHERTVVAVDDAWLLVGLQLRQLEQFWSPLPIVAWRDAPLGTTASSRPGRVRTNCAWEMLGGRTLVFWMPFFRAETLRQAIEMGAMISTVGPQQESPEALRDYVRRDTPHALYSLICRGARPWPDVLQERIQTHPDQNEQLYRTLILEGLDAEAVFSKCPSSDGALLASQLAKTGMRTAQLGNMTVVERAGAWYARRGPRGREALVCEAIIRLDAILWSERGQQAYVQGRVLYDGLEIEFHEPLATIEKDAMSWLRELSVRHGAGLVHCDRQWGRRLLDVARLFSAPRQVDSFERLGWDEREARFTLPGLTICSYEKPTRLDNQKLLGALPRTTVELPTQLSPEEISRAADDTYENRLFWAVAAAVMANVLATNRHIQTLGVALVGAGAQAVGRDVTAAMACANMRICDLDDVRRCLVEEHAHDWPLSVDVVGPIGRQARETLWRGTPDRPRNIIAPASWMESRGLLMTGRWIAIDGLEPATLTRDQRQFAELLLPAYLNDLCRRHLRFGEGLLSRRREECPPLAEWVDAVLRDLGRFAARIPYSSVEATATASCCIAGADVAKGFAELLRHCLHAGDLKLVDRPAARRLARLELVQETADMIYLADEVFAALLKDIGVPAIEKDALVRALVESKAPFEVRDAGFAFPTRWCKRAKKRRRSSAIGAPAAG